MQAALHRVEAFCRQQALVARVAADQGMVETLRLAGLAQPVRGMTAD